MWCFDYLKFFKLDLENKEQQKIDSIIDILNNVQQIYQILYDDKCENDFLQQLEVQKEMLNDCNKN